MAGIPISKLEENTTLSDSSMFAEAESSPASTKKVTFATLFSAIWNKINGKKIKTYDEIMAATEAGYLVDALAVKDGFTKLSSSKDGTLSFLYYPANSVKWCKVGNIVTISNEYDIQGIPAGGWKNIGTLPSDIRPKLSFVVKSSTNNDLIYKLHPSGIVSMYNYGNAVSGAANGAFFATYVSI